MAFRQPFRSGLRELAESLLRRAQTERAYSQVEQQLELQKGQIGANLAQNLTQNLQMGIQGLFQEEEVKEPTYDAGAIRDSITDKIGPLEAAIASQRNNGATDEELADQLALLQNYELMLTLPDERLPDLYAQFIAGDSGDILTRALAGGRTADDLIDMRNTIEAGVAEGIRERLNFDRLDSGSILSAARALEELEALSPTTRAALEPWAQQVRDAIDSNPVYAEAIALDRRERAARAEGAEVDLALGIQALKMAHRMDPVTYNAAMVALREAQGRLDTASQNRVGVALATGNIAGLQEEEKAAVAQILKLPNAEDALVEWSQGQREQYAARMATEDRINELRQQALVDEARIRGVEEVRDAERYEREVTEAERDATRWTWAQAIEEHRAWAAQRERDLAVLTDRRAVFDDALDIRERIAAAITNHDVGLLSTYIDAIERGGPVAEQIINAYGNDVSALMADLRNGLVRAREMEDLNFEMLKYDADYRRALGEEALLRIQEAQDYAALRPLELQALREEYRLNIAKARVDMRALEFDDTMSALGQLGELARALPPDFWDDPPAHIESRLKELDMDVGMFRSISAFEQWKEQEPVRAEAWQQIDLYIQAPPQTQADADRILSSVSSLATNALGMDDVQRNALLTTVATIWNVDDQRLKAYLTNLAGGVLSGDPVQIARALNGYSSVSNSLMREYNEVIPQNIRTNGCGDIIDTTVLGGYIVMWKDAEGSSIEDMSAPDAPDRLSSTCRAIFNDQVNLGNEIRTVNDMQRQLADQLGIAIGAPAPRDRTGNWPTGQGATPSPTPGATGQPTVEDWRGITPFDQAKIYEMVRLAEAGNWDGFADLERELIGRYDVGDLQAILDVLLGYQE